MHGSGNARSLEGFLNLLPVFDQHSVLGKNAGPVGSLLDPLYTHLVNQLVIACPFGNALSDFPVEPFQLGQHDRALQGVHTAPYADSRMDIALALAMDANFAAGLGGGIVIGEDGAAIAVATQGLAGEEAGAANGAQVAALSAFVFSAEALGGVFYDRQLVFGGDGVDFLHVRRLAIEADGHDGAGFRG